MLVTYIKNNTYFVAPRHFEMIFSHEEPSVVISESLKTYLAEAKETIEENLEKWDDFKKIVNPYEYVHSNVYREKYPVSRLTPVSRSFYKFIEIVNHFSILDTYNGKPLKTFHIAEGPGGFIEAIAHLRKEYNSSNNQFRTNDEIVKDAYWGLTLLKNEPGIPSWRKLKDKIRRDNIENIQFFMGKNEDGNLFDYENLEECGRNHYNSCDIVTADGGFDFSLNFEDQERVATKLLLVQILYAIILQKKGGTFIIKFFDMFNYASLELVYILKSFYSTVIVTKPKTSRYANSERYIVACDYIYESSRIFIAPFISIIKRLSSEESNNENIMRILNIDLPHFFVSNMEQANILLGKQQLMTINNTNQLIKTAKNDKIEKMVKMNKEKSVKWCLENNIPHNNIRNENVFKKKNTMKM